MINQGQISVKLILDANGNPIFIDSVGKRHYKIFVYAKSYPDDVYSVEYRLHSSYTNPFRVLDNKSEDFGFKTTTYGDYSISASLLGKKQNYIASCIISQALKDNHETSKNPGILEAIQRIKDG